MKNDELKRILEQRHEADVEGLLLVYPPETDESQDPENVGDERSTYTRE